MFLMPSRFEPCGLNQMYSLRYGTVPIVHAVGGLDDTIQPYTSRARRANGFKFQEPTPDELARVVRQAVRLYHDRPAWRRLMRNGMTADHSWRQSAREYVKVYRRARLEPPRGAASRARRLRQASRDSGKDTADRWLHRTLRHSPTAILIRACSRRRPWCWWISGRSGAVRAARWSRRSTRWRPTTSARCRSAS